MREEHDTELAELVVLRLKCADMIVLSKQGGKEGLCCQWRDISNFCELKEHLLWLLAGSSKKKRTRRS